MKKLILIFSLFVSIHLIAQNTVFNKYYESSSSVTCLPINDAYCIGGHQVVLNNDNSITRHFYVKKTDFYGNALWLNYLDTGIEKRQVTTGNSLIKTSDNNFILVGSKGKDIEGIDMDAILIKFDEQGDIIWKKQYGTLKHEKCYGIIETMDKGYFLYGYQDTDTTSAEFYCVKTDSLGVEEWTQTYSLQGSSVAFSAHQTADKGYIISGYGYHQTKSYQMYIVRTDSVGNQLWEKDYGGNGGDGGGLLIPLEDGNYMLTGNIEENNYYKQYIAKISSIGDVIWDKKLTMGQYLVFEAFKKTQDGLFIASGSQRDYLFEYPTNGIAVKFNSNGDTLWTKTYKTYSDDKDYFRDIEPTADGGFLMAGFNYTQHGSWLVKTDSLGNTCSYLGCDSLIEDTISAIHFTTQKNPYQISLSPNPAINYTEISYYLPTKHPLAHFKLYNLRGATVLQQELTTFKHKKKLDITKFQSGIYVYEVLYQGQKAYSGKLIVE